MKKYSVVLDRPVGLKKCEGSDVAEVDVYVALITAHGLLGALASAKAEACEADIADERFERGEFLPREYQHIMTLKGHVRLVHLP